MSQRRTARQHNQAAIAGACECRDRALDLAGLARVDRSQFYPKRRRHRLDRAHLTELRGRSRVADHRRSRRAGRDFFEQLQPFSADAIFEHGEPGRIATGARQAFNEAGTDRVDDLHDTIGMARVICCSAATLALVADEMTSGASATNSAASLAMTAAPPPPQR